MKNAKKSDRITSELLETALALDLPTASRTKVMTANPQISACFRFQRTLPVKFILSQDDFYTQRNHLNT